MKNGMLVCALALAACTERVASNPLAPPPTSTTTPEPAPVVVSIAPMPAQALVIDSAVQLHPVMTDAAGKVVVTRQPFWSSSNPATATVDSTGVVRARALGITTVAAAIDGIRAEVRVTVAGAAASFSLSPSVIRLGDTSLVRAVVKDAAGTELILLSAYVIVDTTIAAVASATPNVCPSADAPLGTFMPCPVRAKKIGSTPVTGFVNGRQLSTILQVAAPPD